MSRREDNFNAVSIAKTKLYRTIRDKVMEVTGMSDEETRAIVGPLVEQHIASTKKRHQAMSIIKSMLDKHTISTLSEIPNLKVGADGVVVEVKKKDKAEPDPLTQDIHTLMGILRKAWHEHNLETKLMAKVIGVTTSSIYNWLHREDTIPQEQNLPAIATYLKRLDYEIPARFQ